METATTWFKQLFGIKFRHKRPPPPSDDFCRNPNITPAQAAWLRSFYSEPDSDEGIRARAVAAATAAAADAAVAAARAAYEAVRVQATIGTASFGGCREIWAAVNIQRVFRGFLARKALRALKGLVKIQAQMRGFLVRKRAAAALQSMEALVRAQASVRAKKINLHPQFRAPKSLDNEHESPKIVEVDTWCRPKSRSKRIIISKWTTESMSMEDRLQPPPSSHVCSLASTPRYYSRDISPNTWCARGSSTKTRPVRSESAPKMRRASLREVMECRIKGGGVEAVDFKKAVMGKLGVN